jgi:polyphosphate kinase 2 (PPK2 family)
MKEPFMEKYKVQPGGSVDLGKWDPNDKSMFQISKKDGKKKLHQLNQELEELQEMLFAEGKHRLLIILQARHYPACI